MSPRIETRMSQDTFCMYAAVAVSIEERLLDLHRDYERLRSRKYGQYPVVETVEDAYRIEELGGMIADLKEEQSRLAIEMKEAGMPASVHIRYPLEDEPAHVALICLTSADKPKLTVTKSVR